MHRHHHHHHHHQARIDYGTIHHAGIHHHHGIHHVPHHHAVHPVHLTDTHHYTHHYIHDGSSSRVDTRTNGQKVCFSSAFTIAFALFIVGGIILTNVWKLGMTLGAALVAVGFAVALVAIISSIVCCSKAGSPQTMIRTTDAEGPGAHPGHGHPVAYPTHREPYDHDTGDIHGTPTEQPRPTAPLQPPPPDYSTCVDVHYPSVHQPQEQQSKSMAATTPLSQTTGSDSERHGLVSSPSPASANM